MADNLVNLGDIQRARASAGVSQIVNSSTINPTPEKDFLAQFNELAKTVERIVSNGETVARVFQKMQSKNDSESSGGISSPQRVINEQVFVNSPEPEQRFNRVSAPVPKMTQQPKEENMITEENVEKLIEKLILMIKEKVPEDYKEKNINQLVTEYEELSEFKKMFVTVILKKEIIKFLGEKIE